MREEEQTNLQNVEKNQMKVLVKHTKSAIGIDIKPWETDTDLDTLAEILRNKKREGVIWGTMVKKPIAFGISKLIVFMTIDNQLISVEDIEEMITEESDYVQSMEISTWYDQPQDYNVLYCMYCFMIVWLNLVSRTMNNRSCYLTYFEIVTCVLDLFNNCLKM